MSTGRNRNKNLEMEVFLNNSGPNGPPVNQNDIFILDTVNDVYYDVRKDSGADVVIRPWILRTIKSGLSQQGIDSRAVLDGKSYYYTQLEDDDPITITGSFIGNILPNVDAIGVYFEILPGSGNATITVSQKEIK